MDMPITYEQYKQNLDEGRFTGLKCDSCGSVTFPPKTVCRTCDKSEFTHVELEGVGVLKTFTVIRVAPQGKKPPYIVAMAELKEGPWVMGRLEGINPDETEISLIGKEVSLGAMVAAGDVYSDESRYLTFNLKP